MIRVRISTLALAVLLTPAAIPQWVPQSSGTTASLRGISAASDSVVWASGTQGTFLKTLDDAVTWQAEQRISDKRRPGPSVAHLQGTPRPLSKIARRQETGNPLTMIANTGAMLLNGHVAPMRSRP